MNELENEQVQECFAASEDAHNEFQRQQKGGVLDKAKDGLGPESLGGDGKTDNTKRATE
jgi:hypothetical protein